MRKEFFGLAVLLICVSLVSAQSTKTSTHVVPTGKGWGVEAVQGMAPGLGKPYAVTTGNGINYHNGPVMHGTVNVYFIWYGNWTNGAHASDSQSTVTLLNSLFGSSGMNNSNYYKINTTYGDTTANVSGSIVLAGSTTDNYSQGTRLRDAGVKTVVSNAISSGRLPKDTNGLYFVLTSSDVRETSGFCSQYCGWHTHATLLNSDIKYSFVGNPDRCPSACEEETVSPNGNSGADGMASIMAHEAEETATDPDLNAWYDSGGAENADKCAWKFGPVTGTLGNGGYNQVMGGHNWLIQMNWENSRGGGCDQRLGGTFYTR